MLLFIVIVFVFTIIIQVVKFSVENKKLLLFLNILVLILWACLVLSRIYSLIQKEKREIVDLVSSLDESRNIKKVRELDVIYNNPELPKHRYFILEQMDTLVANNVYYSQHDFHKKTEKEREIYKEKNEPNFSHICKLYNDFWYSPYSKSFSTVVL